MVESYDYITEALFLKQIGKKSFGSIRLVINTLNNKIYGAESSHIKTAALLAGKHESDIKKQPESFSHFVTALIVIDREIIIESSVGNCSLENNAKVEHSTTELAKAQLLLKRFIKNSYKHKTIGTKAA